MKDFKTLKGEELFTYFIQDHPDKDYSSVVALLPCAVAWDRNKALQLLERSVMEGKKFVAVYDPAVMETTGMEYVGEIIDGALFLKYL